ncbi:MAG: heavy-metal-associated domain-containing protein [Gammaproteobacteria bacterium]|nr:heavy-metal-associated domain-containing protein [Gammaproteobacteria bacterium]
MIIAVENIKCGGCASTIMNKMKTLDDITDVKVDIEDGLVTIEGNKSRRDDYAAELASIGYPEVGSVHGLGSAGAKAKSFVSCAVGRMSD